jgi:predicted glycosyltransferase
VSAQYQRHRGEKLCCIDTITFDNNIELLMQQAEGIVAMGGYNTFCEILSFDKKALIIPRSKPRKEQLVRANNAAGLGLVQVLDPEEGMETEVMADALRQLPDRPLPSRNMSPRMLEGLERIANLVEPVLQTATRIVANDDDAG